MQKQILERFISKYTLGGMIEILPWKSDGTITRIEHGAENRMVIVHLSCTGLGLPSGEYCIYETAQLRSLLNILGDEISLDVRSVKERPVAFTLRDDASVIDFALADPIAMPQKTPQLNLANIRDDMWDVEFEADPKFIASFTRAKGALNVEDFTVKATNDKLSFVIGYAEYGNSTRVTLNPTARKCTKMEPVKFSAVCLREILMANKEAPGYVRISGEGIMHIQYVMEGFDVDYYLTMKAD